MKGNVVFIILKQELRNEPVEIFTRFPVVFQQHASLRCLNAGVYKRAWRFDMREFGLDVANFPINYNMFFKQGFQDKTLFVQRESCLDLSCHINTIPSGEQHIE